MKTKLTVAIVALATFVAGVSAMLQTPADALQEGNDNDDQPRSSYIVILDAEPILDYDGDIDDLEATATEDGERPDPRDDAVEEYRNYLTRTQNQIIKSVDLKPEDILNRYNFATVGFSALLTDSEATKLGRRDDVTLVERDTLFELTEHSQGPERGVSGGASPTIGTAEHTGEGVVVGVVDTGIWPEHPMFADDGSYEGVPDTWTTEACAFGAGTHNPEDASFECNDKLIGARNLRQTYTALLGAEVYASARDYTGHGTQVAGIAAGAPSGATILGEEAGAATGVAPRARLAAYAACGSMGCYASDVIGAIDRAVADGVDVINYAAVGGSEPISSLGLVLLRATSASVSVATAAGNAGPGAATVGEPATFPWVTSVGSADLHSGFQAAMTIAGEQYAGVSVTGETDELTVADAATRGNPRCDPSVEFEPALDGEMVVCARGAVERIAKSRAVFDQGGGGMIVFNQTKAQSLIAETHWVPTIHLSHRDGQAVRAALAEAEQPLTTEIETVEQSDEDQAEVPEYSSRGPNPATGSILKPDLIAPGTNVLTATTPTPISGQTGEMFQTTSGSSIASGHVAGLMARIREAHPGWSPAAIKSALVTTAAPNITSNDKRADVFAQGAGLVSSEEPLSSFVLDPGVVFDLSPDAYDAYLCDVAPEIIDAETCEERSESEDAVLAEQINLSSIAIAPMTGSATVTRTLTNVTDKTLELGSTVRATEGVSIEVDDENLTVPAGESVSFDVTVTIDDDTRIDSWVFGSIVWEDEQGDYRARVPVAARPVSLDAPDVVVGEEGRAEIEVAFGYDGEYQPTTHGPVAPELLSGEVEQDLTPTASNPGFDVSDAENGAGAHQIEVTDTAHLRISLAPEHLATPNGTDPTEVDLDLYLYDEEGKPVASSITGTSTETIDVSFPGDGTYTLYVHGWSTQADRVEYELRSWSVPVADDDFEVEEAPSSAVTGSIDVLELSWDAFEDESLLGVLDHNGPDGRMAVTVIEVPAGD